MTITQTVSRTKVALTVAVVLGAAGIAAAFVPPLLTPGKNSEKVSASCGSYNQSVCLPCQEGLVQNEFLTCTCPNNTKWSGEKCVQQPVQIKAERTTDELFETNLKQDDKISEATLGTVTITLPKGVEYIRSVTFTETNPAGPPKMFTRFGLGITDSNGKYLRNISWAIFGANASNGLTFNGMDRIEGNYYLFKGLPTDVPLTLHVFGNVRDHEKLPAIGKLQLSYIIADDGNELRSYFEGKLNLQEYRVKMVSGVLNQIKVDSTKYGSSLGVEIKKDDKSPNAVLGIVGVTLPKGTDYVRGVTFGASSPSDISPAFEKLGLRVTDIQGKKLWNEEWIEDGSWVNASNAFTFKHKYKDGGYDGDYLFKGLPTETELIFSVIGVIKDIQKLPAKGKLHVSYIPADGGSQRYYFEGKHELQEYSVKMVSGISVQETQFSITADPPVTQDNQWTIPAGSDNAKIASFRVKNSTERPSFNITLEGLTAGEKYSNAPLFTNLNVRTDNGTVVFYLKNPLKYSQEILVNNGLGPNSSNFFSITADVLSTAPAIGTRLRITSPQSVDLQKFAISKTEPACGGISEKPCWSEYKGTAMPEMTPYGCKKPLFLTNGLCQKQCVLGQTPDGYKCYASVIKPVITTECFAYETNPANKGNILWEQPSFARCAKDLDPKKWDVAPWAGYKITSTSATATDPEACYDEYRSVYRGVTSSKPNYMVYKKVTKSCK